MERADLTDAILDGAQLPGVKMLRAILENASLKGCNFEHPAGTNANMEGKYTFCLKCTKEDHHVTSVQL